MATTPKTQYTKSGGLHIAYQVTGSGPLDLIVVPGFVSHLELSDPVSLPRPPLRDLAISVHLPGDLPASFGITGRYSRQTNYISPPGDFTAAVAMPVGKLTDDWDFICGVDVLASPDTGGIVALGDSPTAANISTIDAFCRWPDQLSRRLQARAGGRPMGVMNQGLGGNRILHDVRGDSGLRRFDRDVLAQTGVTHVIVMLEAARGARPHAPHQDLRRDVDPVRERDLPRGRLDPGARSEAPGRQCVDP